MAGTKEKDKFKELISPFLKSKMNKAEKILYMHMFTHLYNKTAGCFRVLRAIAFSGGGGGGAPG